MANIEKSEEIFHKSQITYLQTMLSYNNLFDEGMKYMNLYRILYEIQGFKTPQELFDADIILTFADNMLNEKYVKLNLIAFNTKIIFYKITEKIRHNNKKMISLIVNNIFTPHIKIKILLIENEVITKPYLTFIRNNFYSQGIKGGILRYYFDKYDLDERIFKIISIVDSKNILLFGGAVRDIIKGITPKDLDFYVPNDSKSYHCIIFLENLGFKVEYVNDNNNNNNNNRYNFDYRVKKYNVYDNDNRFIISMDFSNYKFFATNKDFNINSLLFSTLYNIKYEFSSNIPESDNIKFVIDSLNTDTALVIYKKTFAISQNILMLYRFQKMVSYGFKIINHKNKQIAISDYAKYLGINYTFANDVCWILCSGCQCKEKQCKENHDTSYYDLMNCKEHFKNCMICVSKKEKEKEKDKDKTEASGKGEAKANRKNIKNHIRKKSLITN